MYFHKMTPPQAHDGGPIGTEATEERPHGPSFELNIFVNAVKRMKKCQISQILSVSL